jgi:choice-of-anchor B domain-containing protein
VSLNWRENEDWRVALTDSKHDKRNTIKFNIKIWVMKHLLTTLIFFWSIAFVGLHAQTQQPGANINMRLLGTWRDDSLPSANANLRVRYSGCWGMDINGREIAVVGGAKHILFLDVTDPAKPVLLKKFPSDFTTVWREFRSYKNRVYAVSDGTSEGLRIFDLSKVPGDIVETAKMSTFFSRSHTITIDTLHGRAYFNGTDTRRNGLIVLDLTRNPDQPIQLASVELPGGYIHDSYVRDNIIYASSGYNGLYVYDFTTPTTPRTLASVSTSGYNHNSWLTMDGRYLFYTEEIPSKRPVQVVDMGRLAMGEIQVVKSFLDMSLPLANPGDQGAIAHNVFIKGNLLYNSQYEDGVLVYDITNPLEPKLIARYDTSPDNTKYNGYYGNWGCYPWFRSGNLLAADMQNGVFMVRPTVTSGTKTIETTALTAKVSPNPTTNLLTIQIKGNNETSMPEEWQFTLFNAAGQVAAQRTLRNTDTALLPVDALPRGIYFLKTWSHDRQLVAVEKVVIE